MPQTMNEIAKEYRERLPLFLLRTNVDPMPLPKSLQFIAMMMINPIISPRIAMGPR